MNSCSASSSTVVVYNCYQLAWILAVPESQVKFATRGDGWNSSEITAPYFLLPSWRWRSPLSKRFGYPLTTKLMRAKLVLTWQIITRGSCVRKAWKPSSSSPISIFLNLEAFTHYCHLHGPSLAQQINCQKILFSHIRRWYQFLFPNQIS